MNESIEENNSTSNVGGIGQEALGPIIIRQSSFQIMGQLLVTEVFFALIFIILQTIIIPFSQSNLFHGFFNGSISTLFLLLLIAMKILIIYRIAANWAYEFYSVKKGEIMHFQKGPFQHKEEHFPLSSMEEFTINQGTIGRLFHYGSIMLYNPITKKRFVISSVNNPHIYVEMIENALPNENEFKLSQLPEIHMEGRSSMKKEHQIFGYNLA